MAISRTTSHEDLRERLAKLVKGPVLGPVDMVLAGPISYPPDRAADALRLYHQMASTAPDALATAASVVRDADGKPSVSVVVCWSGPVSEGEPVLRPLREFGPPVADAVGLIPLGRHRLSHVSHRCGVLVLVDGA